MHRDSLDVSNESTTGPRQAHSSRGAATLAEIWISASRVLFLDEKKSSSWRSRALAPEAAGLAAPPWLLLGSCLASSLPSHCRGSEVQKRCVDIPPYWMDNDPTVYPTATNHRRQMWPSSSRRCAQHGVYTLWEGSSQGARPQDPQNPTVQLCSFAALQRRAGEKGMAHHIECCHRRAPPLDRPLGCRVLHSVPEKSMRHLGSFGRRHTNTKTCRAGS